MSVGEYEYVCLLGTCFVREKLLVEGYLFISRSRCARLRGVPFVSRPSVLAFPWLPTPWGSEGSRSAAAAGEEGVHGKKTGWTFEACDLSWFS